jgi:hypothetical protein
MAGHYTRILWLYAARTGFRTVRRCLSIGVAWQAGRELLWEPAEEEVLNEVVKSANVDYTVDYLPHQ